MEKEKSHGALWISLAAASPILYVLSIGPVAWVFKNLLHYSDPPEWVMIFYAPLGWMGEHSSWLNKFLEAYGKLLGF